MITPEQPELDDEKVVISIEVEGRKMEWTEKGAFECFRRLAALGVYTPPGSIIPERGHSD